LERVIRVWTLFSSCCVCWRAIRRDAAFIVVC
jgi:hypothetical protein